MVCHIELQLRHRPHITYVCRPLKRSAPIHSCPTPTPNFYTTKMFSKSDAAIILPLEFCNSMWLKFCSSVCMKFFSSVWLKFFSSVWLKFFSAVWLLGYLFLPGVVISCSCQNVPDYLTSLSIGQALTSLLQNISEKSQIQWLYGLRHDKQSMGMN